MVRLNFHYATALSYPKSANFLEGGQDNFLDMFVLVWPSSRSAQLKQILGPLLPLDCLLI